jgi:NADH dehydrogenase (ubiquinone) 1 alpha subcomplex subunit 5
MLIVRRVAEIESKIGAGLLEEIVQVAQGENLLASVMVENKVYVSPTFLNASSYQSN